MLKDGKEFILTKEEAVKLHREMCRDMAKELGENPSDDERWGFKSLWIKTHGYDEVSADCFLCEYKFQEGLSCDDCLINWGNIEGRPAWCADIPIDVDDGNEKSFFKDNNEFINFECSPVSVVAEAPLKEVK